MPRLSSPWNIGFSWHMNAVALPRHMKAVAGPGNRQLIAVESVLLVPRTVLRDQVEPCLRPARRWTYSWGLDSNGAFLISS
jgi:hypothetical protein